MACLCSWPQISSEVFFSTNQPLKDVWEIFWENNEVAWLVLIPKSIIILFCMWYLFPFNYWLLTGKGDNLADDSLPQINLLGIKLLEKGFPFSRQCNIHHPRRKKQQQLFPSEMMTGRLYFFLAGNGRFSKKNYVMFNCSGVVGTDEPLPVRHFQMRNHPQVYGSPGKPCAVLIRIEIQHWHGQNGKDIAFFQPNMISLVSSL